MIRFRPPTLWSYIARSYLYYLSVSLFGIVAIILSTKLEEIARFIALGASVSKISLFILCLVPYTLQLALPFASTIAAYTIYHQMSRSGELTAARSCGYPLASILSPVATVSFFLCIVMIWGIFDLSAKSHLAAKKLEFDVRDEEPLAFLQNSRFLMQHGIAAELEGSFKTGQQVRDVLLCFPSPTNQRLTLIILKKGIAQKKALLGNLMSVVSSKAPVGLDRPACSLLIENADEKKTPTDFIHELSAKNKWKPTEEQYSLGVVRAVQQELGKELVAAQYQGHSAKKFSKKLGKFTTEPFRRLSLSLAVYTLCIFSAVCGVRSFRKSGTSITALGPILGFGFFILCYLAAKNCNNITLVASTLYLLPHPVLWYVSKKAQVSLEHGME
jgi:lipopolysaccharide export system permease protein